MIDKIENIEVDGIKYPMTFNLNVTEQIQEEYKTITHWSELISKENGNEPNVKALKFGIGAMINEAIDIENEKLTEKRELLTDKQIGRLITRFGTAEISAKAKETIINSTKIESKNE